MDVRQAKSTDLSECGALAASVQSTHVWQVRLAYDAMSAQPGDELGAVLCCTRLPRSIMVQPASAEPLDLLWSRAAEVLVAEDAQGIMGYVALTFNHGAPAATIERLVVTPLLRRHGVGGALLRAAAQWGRELNLETLSGHCAARNYPAARFYMRWGLHFAGYSEAFYARGEIALFWHTSL
jgi:GNAT superfamily N-acetyltransferase